MLVLAGPADPERLVPGLPALTDPRREPVRGLSCMQGELGLRVHQCCGDQGHKRLLKLFGSPARIFHGEPLCEGAFNSSA